MARERHKLPWDGTEKVSYGQTILLMLITED